MDQVSKFGQIMPSMKASGEKTKPMEEENSGMLMETSMRENGKMIKLMALESIFMSMELSMKATGRTTCKTAREWRAGKTAAVTRAATRRA